MVFQDPYSSLNPRMTVGDLVGEPLRLEPDVSRKEKRTRTEAILEEVGLVNETPEEFSEAVEEGTDVAPRVLQETLDLVGGGNLALLAYNEQTADSTTEEVRTAAEEAGVPVVDFTETLPDGETYVTWQQSNLDAIAAALG